MDRFEKLARDIAGMSRRDALRRAGGGLAGALLAAFGLGRARAQDEDGAPGCDEVCDAIYGGPNFDRPSWGRCMIGCVKCPNTAGGTCFGGYRSCTGPAFFCVCFDTVEGGGFCGEGAFCSDLPTCETSADCPTGWTCSANTCCSFFGFPPICNPPCGTSFAGAAPVGGAADGRPTNFAL